MEVDAEDELPQSFVLRCEDYFVDIEVEYQWMPSRCAGCKTFWHLALECPDNPVVPQSVPLEAANSETGNRVYPAIHYIE